MSGYQRPWWLWVNKPGTLTTTVEEESTPDGQCFTIRGEPVIHSLAWLVWGPLSALAIIIVITGLAIIFEVREQGIALRALFILAFLGLPALVWMATVIVVNRVSGRHLQAERDAEAHVAQIRLDPQNKTLHYQTNGTGRETTLDFKHIRAVKVTDPIGVRDSKSVHLTLETQRGKVVLLDEKLGTESQKFDLAREIQTAMDR